MLVVASLKLKILSVIILLLCTNMFSSVWLSAGADPEGGFGDLSPLNFLEVKIIKNVKKILK